ncbi:uncharacterized protein H6S33_011838 [Morchella sextelata]|uniref:uncharacterized protein n=1 Tax=Morchella sextelata TaxID=1174677 RepID=UPI001D05A0FB|nr:uncharacterized protein H6S33_011838 [Morchella sextelata]KAH0610311.1 hypothetical protein H6S33_011838 [Morchella sextelata]
MPGFVPDHSAKAMLTQRGGPMPRALGVRRAERSGSGTTQDVPRVDPGGMQSGMSTRQSGIVPPFETIFACRQRERRNCNLALKTRLFAVIK